MSDFDLMSSDVDYLRRMAKAYQETALARAAEITQLKTDLATAIAAGDELRGQVEIARAELRRAGEEFKRLADANAELIAIAERNGTFNQGGV